MNGLVYSASLMAAFLGGMLALFAPCCIVTLLPSFVAASMQRGLRSLPSTALLFSAGLAVILLPILLGIGALGQLIGRYHTWVFITVGVFLMLLGLYILTGKRWSLPMPMMTSVATRGHNGTRSTFFLGVASGVASSCCAPVMAGVVAMSALSASWVGALGLGLSYILGMVFPLLLFAIAAHRRGERRQRTPRRVNMLGTELLWTDALSGSMFLVFGALTALLGVSGESSITPGPLANWDRWITQQVGDIAVALGKLPLVLQAALIIAVGALVITPLWRAVRGAAPVDADGEGHAAPMRVRDPVCGMSVTVGTGTPSTSWSDVNYSFCSPACLEAFKASPEAFADLAPARP